MPTYEFEFEVEEGPYDWALINGSVDIERGDITRIYARMHGAEITLTGSSYKPGEEVSAMLWLILSGRLRKLFSEELEETSPRREAYTSPIVL